ncbi:MAG: dinitrogenase iron-molybdenum cofactor biosynthesis protein [Anaerolineae bacterium]|nr:dinitrogenase iron-molybdenum cofactor biosynthesis protein [Anaerolineae bacterium]MCB9130378.1 dinitrogenase iron-molybdenum cofactor biosynthesis protein [Anaerolineales bacterium]MCB0232348.1 dinitrogenase iron-molybdenum cofactor biosynthesis protein [Anaerolineae bacterium]MCB0234440.1 dinitrogenase iron-molybdenum cofactor biosynthesis protein [Anaerolineae bacterium]MCB0239556.1 dinitrogenase iron-molybdenum cofactor biosynthesis protein [Anaerolineae bacterium]
MKIAVVTDDQTTISRHFGRAQYYLVFTVEDGEVVQQELRPKLGHNQFQLEEHHEESDDHQHEHGHGQGQHSQEKHSRMMANLVDCQVLLAGGMGMGAQSSLLQIGVNPVLTDIRQIDAAVSAYLNGTLVDQPKLVH